MTTGEKELFLSFNDNGYSVIRHVISEELLKNYEIDFPKDKYFKLPHQKSYLPTRHEHLITKSISDIFNHPAIASFLNMTGFTHSLHVSEARYGSSEIGWHRDCGADVKPNMYIGALVCLEEASKDSGLFEVIPGSHTWEVDKGIIDFKKCDENPVVCYEYYQNMVNQKSSGSYLFDGKRGDVILWSGLSVHRGSMPEDNFATRHSLFGHFSTVSMG